MTPEQRKAYILDNLQRAIVVMQGVDPDNVDLSTFRCGTKACLAGWLCTDSHFKTFMRLVPRSGGAYGGRHTVILDRNAGPVTPRINTGGLDFAAEFGPYSLDLFAERAEILDEEAEESLSDHDVALRRLENQLAYVTGLDANHLFNPEEVLP